MVGVYSLLASMVSKSISGKAVRTGPPFPARRSTERSHLSNTAASNCGHQCIGLSVETRQNAWAKVAHRVASELDSDVGGDAADLISSFRSSSVIFCSLDLAILTDCSVLQLLQEAEETAQEWIFVGYEVLPRFFKWGNDMVFLIQVLFVQARPGGLPRALL